MTVDIKALARELLMAWLPGAKIDCAPDGAFDALLVWEGPGGTVRYMLGFKQHLPQQDIQVLGRRLKLQAKNLPKAKAVAKPLLLAPYVPPKQAAFLCVCESTTPTKPGTHICSPPACLCTSRENAQR